MVKLVEEERFGIGERAGALAEDGYRYITIDGQQYPEHEVAWLYVHGQWPDGELEHIDGNRANNRIENLKELP